MTKKTLVPKTLKEIDKKPLGEVSPEFVEKQKVETAPDVCLLCTSERIKKVSPEVRLEEKVLCECLTCKERFYK